MALIDLSQCPQAIISFTFVYFLTEIRSRMLNSPPLIILLLANVSAQIHRGAQAGHSGDAMAFCE